jgi:hypothetical protein
MPLPPPRFGHNGPLTGLRQFLASNSDFTSDRSRELLFTDHSWGYLRRTKVSGAAGGAAVAATA